MIMLIVGLGNPGKEYEKTRHNVGFWCLDKLASFFSIKFEKEKKYIADIAVFNYESEIHYLLKPLTYMNNSGEAVEALVLDKNILPEQVLVIEDDINLPIGKIRLRANGSAGGHNGLKSIISKIGDGFWRLRIGVGQPKENCTENTKHEILISHVLGEVSKSENEILKKVINIIPDLIQDWLSKNGSRAMNKYNSINFSNE